MGNDDNLNLHPLQKQLMDQLPKEPVYPIGITRGDETNASAWIMLMDAILKAPYPPNESVSQGYVIYPQQFIDEGYELRIAKGECDVYLHTPPPPDDAPEWEKWAYAHALEKYGNVDAVASIKREADDYYILISPDGRGKIGCSNQKQLLVWPK